MNDSFDQDEWIDELTRQNKILREALERIIHANETTSDPHVEIDVTARQALEETE